MAGMVDFSVKLVQIKCISSYSVNHVAWLTWCSTTNNQCFDSCSMAHLMFNNKQSMFWLSTRWYVKINDEHHGLWLAKIVSTSFPRIIACRVFKLARNVSLMVLKIFCYMEWYLWSNCTHKINLKC
jgi:hypothetical protein